MSDTAFPNLTALARETGVPEYRLGMLAALVSLPVVATVIAVVAAALS